MSVFIGYPSFMAYQMMKGKKDNNDGFPSIPGMIARYSASGLTNEQMATNPVWVDKTGNGHDLQLKNFSWKGMSRVGGYGDENHQTFYKFTLDDYVFIASPPGAKHMNFTFMVTGLQPGNKLTLAFFGTTNTVYGTWNKDGIYTVNAICSDGRIYSKDWKESIYNEETESTSKNFLTIGYSGNAYTKIAFKNLAIYPTVLSREDCIKAYNYLQTLKAK